MHARAFCPRPSDKHYKAFILCSAGNRTPRPQIAWRFNARTVAYLFCCELRVVFCMVYKCPVSHFTPFITRSVSRLVGFSVSKV